MDQKTKDFLEGLASFGVVFMQLAKGTKRTIRSWDDFENWHHQRGESRIDLATQWLKGGFGVGYLPRNHLAAIDADAQVTVHRLVCIEQRLVGVRFPRVYTPSGGVHALFVHPPEIYIPRLKNHICHPMEGGMKVPWDFKLGERTMLVAPGTVMPKGVYKAGDWLQPPVLDVRRLAPGLEIYKVLPQFIRDNRPFRDRTMNAMTYLRTTAPISIKGRGSRLTLGKVARRVVAFHDLDPGLAFHLLTVNKGGWIAWNNRCLDEYGKPCPWDPDEIMDALYDALDAAPEYGVHLYKRQEARAHAFQSLESFLAALTYLPEPAPGTFMKRSTLYGAFIEFAGVESEFFNNKEFGTHIGRAIENGQVPFVQRHATNRDGKIYLGIDEHTLKHALDTYEQRQRDYSASA